MIDSTYCFRPSDNPSSAGKCDRHMEAMLVESVGGDEGVATRS